jgi:hypothetical protein
LLKRIYLRRMVGVLILGVGRALSLIAQEKEGFKIELDPSLRSEAMQVHYYLVGGFGGYGAFTDGPRALTEDLFLPIYRGGQRAKSLKAVVYGKGCELGIFALNPLPPGTNRVRFECRKLGTVWLKGVVIGHSRPSELTVRLRYRAYWSHTFFEIFDGPVLSLAIAEVAPDRDGRFAIEVPDFANDGVTNLYEGQADWSLTAWKTGTNDHYWLKTDKQANRLPGTLAIEREYPEELQFVAQPF